MFYKIDYGVKKNGSLPWSSHSSQLAAPFLQLVERSWPVILQQSRQRTIREQPAFGLAPTAIVGLVACVDASLNRGAADWTGLAIPAVDRHVLAEGGDFFGKLIGGFRGEP